MPALDDVLEQRIHDLHDKCQRRYLHGTEYTDSVRVVRDGKSLLCFSGNDYFALSDHPEVKQAGQEALARYGAGARASRLVTGNHGLYASLEQRLAQMKHTQAALVFGSGYLANQGVISVLMGKGDLILADKWVHACMLDGAVLSGAKLLRFAHNDISDAKRILGQHRGSYRYCLIMTETVFSMDGDVAPMQDLAELAETYDAWLLSDDAHGLGIVEHTMQYPHTIQVGTLSKAVGGYGGYVCGSHILKEYLLNSARSFIFSTGLPPAVVASADKALEIMAQDKERCARPLQLAHMFTGLLGLPPAQSAIVPVIIGESEAALKVSAALQEAGFLVSAIRPPTVLQGSARLRVTFSAAHTEEMVLRLAEAVKLVI